MYWCSNTKFIPFLICEISFRNEEMVGVNIGSIMKLKCSLRTALAGNSNIDL